MNRFSIFLAAAALAITGTSASAATLLLDPAAPHAYQHTVNSPCIIAGNNCPHQPAGFDYTQYSNSGALNATTQTSPDYTVAQLLAFGDFMVGVDTNDTNSAQTLDSFAMYVNGVLVDLYTGTTGNVLALANGVGYADYLISGFTSLSSYASDAIVTFQMSMSGMNDGPDSFFLIPGMASVPLPGAGLLLLGGLGALTAAGRRRRSA